MAQLNLGVFYHNGEGVLQNYEKAVEWVSKAASQGFADAQFYLAISYYEGEGIERNVERALVWLRKAAKQGHINAKEMLAALKNRGGDK
jgi:TPR repeat protein